VLRGFEVPSFKLWLGLKKVRKRAPASSASSSDAESSDVLGNGRGVAAAANLLGDLRDALRLAEKPESPKVGLSFALVDGADACSPDQLLRPESEIVSAFSALGTQNGWSTLFRRSTAAHPTLSRIQIPLFEHMDEILRQCHSEAQDQRVVHRRLFKHYARDSAAENSSHRVDALRSAVIWMSRQRRRGGDQELARMCFGAWGLSRMREATGRAGNETILLRKRRAVQPMQPCSQSEGTEIESHSSWSKSLMDVTSSQEEPRAAALAALAKIENPILPAVSDVISSQEERRASAVAVVAKIENSIVPALAELTSCEEERRVAAVPAAAKMELLILPAVAARDSSQEERRAAADAAVARIEQSILPAVAMAGAMLDHSFEALDLLLLRVALLLWSLLRRVDSDSDFLKLIFMAWKSSHLHGMWSRAKEQIARAEHLQFSFAEKCSRLSGWMLAFASLQYCFCQWVSPVMGCVLHRALRSEQHRASSTTAELQNISKAGRSCHANLVGGADAGIDACDCLQVLRVFSGSELRSMLEVATCCLQAWFDAAREHRHAPVP